MGVSPAKGSVLNGPYLGPTTFLPSRLRRRGWYLRKLNLHRHGKSAAGKDFEIYPVRFNSAFTRIPLNERNLTIPDIVETITCSGLARAAARTSASMVTGLLCAEMVISKVKLNCGSAVGVGGSAVAGGAVGCGAALCPELVEGVGCVTLAVGLQPTSRASATIHTAGWEYVRMGAG